MKVRLIAHTITLNDVLKEITEGVWEPEDGIGHAEALCEFAGRGCYESWTKPNPATATNQGYHRNILESAHLSVMEHGSVSFHIEGISRATSHEAVRHRHHSPSQLSQRFALLKPARPGERAFAVPPLYEAEWVDDPSGVYHGRTQAILERVWKDTTEAYEELVALWMPELLQRGVDPHRARKMVREAARSVLPNMTPTKLVLTANHRAWRHFVINRGSIHADAEMRRLACEIFELLTTLEPNLYQDIEYQMFEGEVCVVHRELAA